MEVSTLVDLGRIDENSFLSVAEHPIKEDKAIPDCSKLSMEEITR